MRLKKTQKEAVIEWLAEGLKTPEINKRAAVHRTPFSVSRAQVDYCRRTRKIEMDVLLKAGEFNALNSGLALVDERVARLQALAELMWNDLTGGFLWLEDVKGVGSGEAATTVDFETFNRAEVDAFRGVLDDIAKEVGHRKQVTEPTGKNGGPIEYQENVESAREQFQRLITSTAAREKESASNSRSDE